MNPIEVDDTRCICDACGKLSIYTGFHSRIGVFPTLLVVRCDECGDSSPHTITSLPERVQGEHAQIWGDLHQGL